MKIPSKFTAAEVAAIRAEFGPTVRSAQLFKYDKRLFAIANKGGATKISRGIWKLPDENGKGESTKKNTSKAQPTEQVAVAHAMAGEPARRKVIDASQRFISASNIPSADPRYVPFGDFAAVKKVVASRRFFPIFITGESGNGKTLMVEQACAAAKRELFRVNFTPRTDEGELIGEIGLNNGDTYFEEGVVIAALRRGAVLLLDELDYASPEGFTPLQSILEGAPYLIKKTGEIVHPAPGFTVIATANTKGQGDARGRYYGSQLLNEAFLERFPITIEQDYPSESVETKILASLAREEEIALSEEQITSLVGWAKAIRNSYNNESVESTMTTRRLVHIVRAFGIFGNLRKAVESCVNRFEPATKKAFIQFFAAVEKGEPVDATADSGGATADSGDAPTAS